MNYYWISFSKIVPYGEHGFLGVVIVKSEDHLSPNEAIDLAISYGGPPAPSIEAAIIDENTASTWPHNCLITPDQFINRTDYDTVRSTISVCSECASSLNEQINN